MIRLVFTTGRETLSIEINDKILIYKDRRFTEGFPIMPLTHELRKKLLTPRISRIPKEIVELINDTNRGQNLKEYEEAQTDEELSIIVKRDAALKGCIFQKRINS